LVSIVVAAHWDILRTTDKNDHEARDGAFDAIAGRRGTRPVRIVIAADHLVRQGIRALLSREPDWVVCGEAATWRQALAKVLELKPDVLILDVGLPEMNGLEVARRVRSTLPVAVLIVTVHDADQVEEAIKAEASGYLLKADADRTLTDALRAVLRHGELFSAPVSATADASSSEDQARARRGSWARLTAREREVLRLLAEGQRNKEIAAALGIATKTVETHRARIMAKLKLHSMAELVRRAIRDHVIEP
jgi:DNA-binding NarL/FixJ family response regulator